MINDIVSELLKYCCNLRILRKFWILKEGSIERVFYVNIQSNMLNGRPHGYCSTKRRVSLDILKGIYKEGIKVGMWYTYQQKYPVYYKGMYNRGEKHGKWTYYNNENNNMNT